MPYRVTLYSPDRHIRYDGRTPDAAGVGGGITARVSLLAALAAEGHRVTAHVNCAEPVDHDGVQYVPLDAAAPIDCDVLIAITTGGDMSFAPLRAVPVTASLRLVWLQGAREPRDLAAVSPDYLYVASNFLRDVCVERWGLDASRVFVCYNGLRQDRFRSAEASGLARDPFALAYIGPPDKGLDAGVEVLRRLRADDPRYRLDVFGGAALWGDRDTGHPDEPGVAFRGLVGQRALVPQLFGYEYGLALQSIEEGFGIAVQEAKRAGQIVLASRVGAFPELIRSGQDGVLLAEAADSPAAADEAAAIVLDLAQDPARRRRLRVNAMRTPWDWPLAAVTWTAHWDHVLGGSSRPAPAAAARPACLDLPDGRHDTASGRYCPSVYPFSPMHARFGATDRVLVGGYYGHGNLGDEAILQAMLDALRHRLPNVSVTVASADPALTRRRHQIDAVHERDLPALVEEARQADLLLLGGGLFHDYHGIDETTLLTHWHWGLTYCAAFPVLATLFDKPFMVYGAGVGPLASESARRYTALIVDRAAAVTVRDRESLAQLEALGARTDHVSVTADPAFAFALDDGHRRRAPGDRPSHDGRLIVALRDWEIGARRADWTAALAAGLDRFLDRHAVDVMFVPFHAARGGHARDDRAIAYAVRRRMRRADAATIAKAPTAPAELVQLLATADLVLSMRLHGVILAAVAGVPVVALAYDPKVRGAMAQLGLEDFCADLAGADAEMVATRLDAAWRARETLRAGLSGTVPSLRAAAIRSAGIAEDVLRARARAPAAASPEWTRLLHDALGRQTTRAERSEQRAEALEEERDGLRDACARLEAERARLQATCDRLGVDLAGLPARVDAEHVELSAIRASRAWRAVSSYRRARRGLARLARHPIRTARDIARAVLPSPLRARLRQAIGRRLQSPHAYVFDRYWRARAASFGPHLGGLRGPGEPGLVSVVLPAFNGARLIGESIDSVLAQTYARFELIVVDDGSTDDTARIARAFAARDPRVRVLRQDNRKLPRALSTGFRAARGEFLTWTSCDNRMKPRFLERMVDGLRRHPRWDMTYANLDLIGETGAPLRDSDEYAGYQRPSRSEHIFLPRVTDELNVRANNYVGAAFLYRSHVAALIGDYSPYRFVSEDYDYWMRVNALLVLRHADFDAPVYDYRFHRASLTSRWAELRMLEHRDRLMVFEDFRRDFYLLPMIWIVEGEGPMAAALRERVRHLGHLLFDGSYDLAALPRWSVPVVLVQVTPSPGSAVAPAGPLQATRVLVTDAAPLPPAVDGAWDLGCAVGPVGTLPRLEPAGRGWLAAPDVASLTTAVDIAVKARHLARIEADVESPPPPSLDASVVICSHRSGPRVVQAIESALRQTWPADRYEILVVNNDPRNTELARAVDALGARWCPDRPERLRTIVCPIRGLSAARNAGLAEARGEIVSFLDDDALAHEDWLEHLVRAFAEHPDAGVVGGHIHLRVPEPRPRVLRPGWEKYWSHFVTPHDAYTAVREWWEFPWGANWSARRVALLQAGGFRSRYGRTGDNAWGGEELVAAALVQRLGYTVAVLPRARVDHDVDPARFTWTHVRRTLLAGHRVARLAQRDLYIPRTSGIGLALRALLGHHRDPHLPPGRARFLNTLWRKFVQLQVLLDELRELTGRLRPGLVAVDPGSGRRVVVAPGRDPSLS